MKDKNNDKKVLDSHGFDKWAADYDKSVKTGDEDNRYPFAAYEDVINQVFYQASKVQGKRLLDLGFGTGELTERFYNAGYKIDGIDFSKEMKIIAEKKMPKARLINYDFSKGLPEAIENEKYDVIISTYAIHHLKNPFQYNMIRKLMDLLKESGLLIIGDVITETSDEMYYISKKDEDIWDDGENYIVVEELKRYFNRLEISFIKKSYCSGVIILKN